MGMMRRLIAVGVGLAAGAVAATVLKKLNDPILDEDEVMIPPQQPEEADETVEAPAAAEEPAEEPAAPAAEEGKAEEPAPAPATDAPNANPVQLGAAEARWARTASWTPPALPLRRISATGMTWAAADKQNQYGLLCASRSKRVRRAAHCVFAGRAGWRNR